MENNTLLSVVTRNTKVSRHLGLQVHRILIYVCSSVQGYLGFTRRSLCERRSYNRFFSSPGFCKELRGTTIDVFEEFRRNQLDSYMHDFFHALRFSNISSIKCGESQDFRDSTRLLIRPNPYVIPYSSSSKPNLEIDQLIHNPRTTSSIYDIEGLSNASVLPIVSYQFL